MASILKVDELQGITSAGDITVTSEGGAATQSLQQGLVKVWAKIEQRAAVGIDDSFNVSSGTDASTGAIEVNLSNNMSAAEYSISGLGGYYDSPSQTDLVGAYGMRRNYAPTTSQYKTQAASTLWSDSGGVDLDNNCSMVAGDLA